MKIARNTTANLRHDWLSVAANKNVAEVSLLALRTEISVDVTIGGVRHEAYWLPEKLAAVLAKQIQEDEADEKRAASTCGEPTTAAYNATAKPGCCARLAGHSGPHCIPIGANRYHHWMTP